MAEIVHLCVVQIHTRIFLKAIFCNNIIHSNLLITLTYLRIFNSVGQSSRLITEKSGVQVPEDPFVKM